MKKNKTYIIAEVAQAHDGSLGMAHSYIDSLKNTGVDALKFQMHYADYESSIHEKFRTKFSYQDKSRFDYWKRLEFTKDQWMEIKKHCDEVGLDFICSVFSEYSLKNLIEIGGKIIKVPSGELSNHLLLERISKTKKKIILSTGLSNNSEIQESIRIFKKYKNNISILHCTSEYPTKPQSLGLGQIKYLKNKFKVPVGLSDHSGKIYAPLMAITKGAEIIEAHVVFDKRIFGPDTNSSLTVDDFKLIAEGARYIEKSNNNEFINKNSLSFKTKLTKKIFGKSLVINKNLQKGHLLKMEDLSSLKPEGFGLSPRYYKKILLKKLKRDMNKNDFISLRDVTI